MRTIDDILHGDKTTMENLKALGIDWIKRLSIDDTIPEFRKLGEDELWDVKRTYPVRGDDFYVEFDEKNYKKFKTALIGWIMFVFRITRDEVENAKRG